MRLGLVISQDFLDALGTCLPVLELLDLELTLIDHINSLSMFPHLRRFWLIIAEAKRNAFSGQDVLRLRQSAPWLRELSMEECFSGWNDTDIDTACAVIPNCTRAVSYVPPLY